MRARKRVRRALASAALLALAAFSPVLPAPAHSLSSLGAAFSAPAIVAHAAASRALARLGTQVHHTPPPARPGARLAPSLPQGSSTLVGGSALPAVALLAAAGLAAALVAAWWLLGFVGRSSRTRGQPRGMAFAL